MKVEVSSNVVSMLLGEAQAADPSECCGILLGAGARIVEARAARKRVAELEEFISAPNVGRIQDVAGLATELASRPESA